MITQAELEKQTYDFGRGRAERIMEANEANGRAITNGYSKAILRRFVIPLAEIIREDVETPRAGRRKAHVVLLKGLDYEAVAYLAVRNVLNGALSGGDADNGRAMILAVGKAIYHEHLLSTFADAEPALFHTIASDLDRRMSKSERHRVRVFQTQASAKGVEMPAWSASACEQVGAYLVDQLMKLGMVFADTSKAIAYTGKHSIRTRINIILTPEVLDLIGQVKGHIVETMPYFVPCIEAPKDWTSPRDGGYHTDEMRRLAPFAIQSRYYRSEEDYPEADPSVVLEAMNALQRTAWQVNGPVLDAIKEIAKHYDMEEILSQAEFPAPTKPAWLFDAMKTEDMTPEQLEEFVAWKREKAAWFTEMRIRGTKFGRFYTAVSVADRFREFPEIFFVYFADFRGRLYARTSGVNPQGSDMQKALIRFAEGKPLNDEVAVKWFLINGANRWGYDKASLDDRAKWVQERADLIYGFAEDPINNRGWQEADKPLQFLAWAMEFKEWTDNPITFKSHLAVGLDGTCNGLQNFSAMLRDAVGGAATNLIPSDLPNDIYQMVADRTMERLVNCRPQEVLFVTETETVDGKVKKTKREATEEERAKSLAKATRFKTMWIKHGMNRTLVKRSVMTLPYGSTRFSCADFIVSDYLKMGKAPEFTKEEYRDAAQWLSHFVWESIGDVVVKAVDAMAWLQAATKHILNGGTRGEEYVPGERDIRWVSPSGFPVIQRYQTMEEHRIKTQLCGSAFLRTYKDTEAPDKNRHKNGIAPNFVHSTDSAHLHRTTVAAYRFNGMALSMIHDDYGTHAADTQKLYELIRSEFVRMYSDRDYLQEFADRYDLPEPPAQGNLDLALVLESAYFFS